MRDYQREVSQVIEGIKPYLQQYLLYSNLSKLFESTSDEFTSKVMERVEIEENEIHVRLYILT